MVKNGVLGIIQGGISETLEKAKGLAGNHLPGPAEEISLSAARSQRKALMQEKQKYLCYMGMAAYQLYREGKIEHEELTADYEKLCEIDGRIDDMDQAIEKQQNAKRPKNICECGARLSRGDQFCPQCGKRVKEEAETAKENFKICICGARVPEGQAMCMECGRMVEQQEEEKDGSK